MADFGQALNDNPVLGALNMFKDQMGELQTSRALRGANEQVRQIRESEMKDEEKTQHLRGIAQDLTAKMLQGGANPSQVAAAVQGFPGPKPLIQSFDQAMIYGSKEEQDAAKAGEQFKSDLKIKEIKAKPHEVDPIKALIKEQGAFATFDKSISADKARFGTFGQAAKTIQSSRALQALIADTDPNKLTPTQLYETAASFGTMVKGGVLTHEELKLLFPQTAGMTQAKIEEFFTNKPMPANAGGFVELYKKGALREASLASANVQESILSAATGNSLLAKMSPGAEEHFKETIAGKIKQLAGYPLQAGDIIITPQGKVTTKQMESADLELRSVMDNIKDAKKALNSKDLVIAGKAKKYLEMKGLSAKQSIGEMQQVMKYQTLTNTFAGAKHAE